MNDEILLFLEKQFKEWLNELERDAYDKQRYYGEEQNKMVKNRNDLFKELIEKRKKQIIEHTKKEVLKKLSKEEIEILGLK